MRLKNVESVQDNYLTNESQASTGSLEVQTQPSPSSYNADDTKNTSLVKERNNLPITFSDGVFCLDLSSRNIDKISNLDELKMVEYMYLEGNKLTELPANFFSTLANLRWLDIRNNLLSTLPKDIAYHPKLETLLLQGNQITELPLELGLLPKLRGIQLQGNPIQYPPPDVISKGTKNILQFLREELEIQSPSNIRPIAEPFYHTSQQKDVKERKGRKFKSLSCFKSDPRNLKKYSEQLFLDKVPPLTCIGSSKPLLTNSKARPKSHIIMHDFHTPKEDQALDPEAARLQENEVETIIEKMYPHIKEPTAYEKKLAKQESQIRQKYLRDMWMHRIREMLNQQAKILQKRQDQKILKEWRLKYQREQMCPKEKEKFELNAPYDFDPDLVFDGTEKLKPIRTAQRLREINDEMADIFISLQKMGETKIDNNLSPRSRQKSLDDEIRQLAQLQRKLEVLKSRNTKEDATSNILQRNTKGRRSAPLLKKN